MLKEITGKDSAAKMRPLELHQVLDTMKAKGFKYKSTSQRRQSPKSGQAKTAEIDKIRAIWITMGKQGFVRDNSEAALDSYARRITTNLNQGAGISATAWLTTYQAVKVLESLKNWHRRLMADWLIKQGITRLNGDKKDWDTKKAPYDYVASVYAAQQDAQA